MTLAGHGSRWSAPRELPSHQCSPLSHYGRAHGKEAGANDETCPERRRSLSLTYELMRLRTNTCLDSWVRRMAQTTGRQPGAAHRPLARGMKRPSSTALRQGRSFPEFTLSKRMTGSLRPSSDRRERMEHRRPKHKSEPRHPAPFEVPWARHPPRRPAGQTPAAEHRLHQADKQLVRVLPRTRMVTQQGRRRHHFSNNRYPVDHHSMRPTRGAREVDHRPQQKRLRAGKRGEMPGPARGWQMAGPSGKGSLGQTQAQPSFLAGDFGKPSSGPLCEPQKGHSTSGAKAHAQRRTGPRGTPRRVAQASPTAPCTTQDPLRLKRKGRWCRLDRPLRHGAVIGPVAGPRRLGKFLGITRCDQSVLLFQVREAISQHKGQHVLDKSASGSLRDRCVQCCDLRAGSAYTTSCKPQSTRPWPDHAPHGCRRPEQCKIDNGPDARGLKQPPSQQEVRVDLRCISNMDEDELMLHACLRAEQLLQNLAAVSGKPGLEAITEDQLIQASAMCHCSITQELKGGLINDQAAKASCRPHASEMWSPSYSCPPGPSSSRSLVHRGGLALGVEGKIYTCQYQLRGKRPTCRRAIIGRGHWRGDSVDSVASMSGGPTQAPADGEQVHSPGRSRGCKTCLHASGPQPGMLPVGKDQIRSSDRTTGFLALESAYAEQQHLSWLCVLFLSSPKQVCAPSTQMGEAQEAEDEGASPRPRRYPRSRYRPDGTRRRTAGELRARGARNQWPPSTSQNKGEPTIGPGASKRGNALSPCNLVLKPTSGNTEDEHRDYGWRNWDSRSRDGQTGGQEEWQPGNTEDATVAGTGSPPTQPAAAAGPTTLDGRTPPEIGSRLKDTEALPTLQRGGARLLRPLTTALSIAARHWDDKGSQADRRGDDPLSPDKGTRRQQEPAGAPGSRTSAPSAGAEPATQAPQAMQRAGSKPPQPKHVCQKKWALLEDLQLVIHKANSKKTTDLLYD